MGGRNYNEKQRQLLLSAAREATLQRMARTLISDRCARGEHRTETDSETGDEVCRFCHATVES